ncbi:class I SAM-dependent DNA methyltransferase [Actinomycetospora straminea]|uniref:class I SAM-dependent DNA methyltransferase n=1 Tax=Actinomycetospora straminea TaxID=663607 RepID=UPI0023666328|nr:class I SAM-dependent methyltransferase [Actinomycetospora straminea]MDD7935649.1 class I SAM-dependent methyltransferase [Actinomycetospora straminea]
MDDLRRAWDEQADRWIAWARRPGHDTYERWHRDAFLPILPGPGRLTVDLGCGEGRLTRYLRSAGHRVVGVDGSPRLVAAAHGADPSGPVLNADAAALPLGDGVADLVVAFMSLHDVDDLDGAVDEVARVLVPGGVLCVAVVHPLNSAGTFRSRAAGSEYVVEGSYLGGRRYADSIERAGLGMTFHSLHHPLQDYTRAFERNGLLVEALREPAVPDEAVRDDADRRWQRVPLFLHLRARLGEGTS